MGDLLDGFVLDNTRVSLVRLVMPSTRNRKKPEKSLFTALIHVGFRGTFGSTPNAPEFPRSTYPETVAERPDRGALSETISKCLKRPPRFCIGFIRGRHFFAVC